jgi:hypothetical protein
MKTMHPEAQEIAAYAGLRTLMGSFVGKGVITHDDTVNILNDAAHPLFHYVEEHANQKILDAARLLMSDSLDYKSRWCA